jgi:tetratricopeptide (TPR) repeat protein
LGDVHRKEKKWREAISYYERVLAIDDKDLYALTGLYCSYFLGLSELVKAKEIENRLAKIEPTKKTLLMKLGDAYRHENRFDEAKDCYRKIIAIDPNNEAARAKLVELG